jgi:hypothetical protein
MTTSVSATPEQPMVMLRYFDVVLLVLATPIVLLIGVSATGYCIAAAAWIVLRAIGVVAERGASAAPQQSQQIGLRLGYMLLRLFALALTIILIRRGAGRDAGLAALLVIVFAFTMQLGISAITRPRSR